MAITASTGISSGIDYASLIEGLIKIERQPITLMENRQSALSSTKSALSTLSSKLKELQSAADALKTEAAFKVFSTSVSDTTTFTASAGSTASAGTYQIKVIDLAQKHSIASNNGTAASTTVIGTGAGTFKFKLGSGAEQTVNVDATTTLQGLADAINAKNAGITASVINTTGATPYKLVLKSNTEGASNTITIIDDDFTNLDMDGDNIPATGGGGITTLQSAKDAEITVDGLTIKRSSNTITDVIDGVTINLLKTDAVNAKTLTITRDTDAIKKKIEDLVNKYNSVMDYIKANNKYDSKTKTKGPLYGEAVVKTVMEKLRSTVQSTISGLANTEMNELREAGISIDSKGKLSINSTKLSDAISNKFNDVVNMFIDSTETTRDGFGVLIYDAVDIFTNADGSITKRMSGYDSTISSLDRQIEQKESKLDRYAETLRLRFAALESMITSLKAQQDYLAANLGR